MMVSKNGLVSSEKYLWCSFYYLHLSIIANLSWLHDLYSPSDIYANPFEQQLHWMEMTASMMPTCQTILRERLLAAMLMHECCSSVTGGMIDNMPHLQDLVKKIQTCFNLDDLEERKKSLLDNFLYPLNQAQVTRRFGVSFQKDDPLFMKTPTFEECRDALAKAIKENSVLRSAGVKFEVLPDTTFIQLEGLENYFRA